MNNGGAAISLTYVAADRVIPGGCLPVLCTAGSAPPTVAQPLACGSFWGPIQPAGVVPLLTLLTCVSCPAGYGGGMSSAKAALESDTRVLAYEAGRK